LNSYELTLTTPSRWRVYQLPPPRHELPCPMILAGVAGFEPATCGFGDRCSTSLSYTPEFINYIIINWDEN
jgi:hypothetical protein